MTLYIIVTFFKNGYKEVEYIESTGTQYIDTGYIPKTNTKLELTLSFSGEYSPEGLNMYIFFSTASMQDDFFGVNFGGGEGGQNSLFTWFDKSFYAGGSIETLTISDDIRTNKNTITVENGHISYGTAERTITSKSADQTTSMILFGFSNYEDDPIPISALNMKVYRLKLYENNVLVREYVPCYRTSDNEVGLYEVVNNVFYPNNGTGTFNKGNDVETSGTMENQHFVYNEAQNLKRNRFSRTGYTFNGWNTKADGTGIAYSNKQNVNNLTTVDSSTINLYGQWIYVGEGASSGDEEITNKNIIDYDVDLGIDVDGNSQYDWEYFYNDGDNIYIIAEDYIPMNSSLVSNSLGNEKGDISSHPCSFFYDMTQGEDTVINNGKTGSADLFGNNVSDSNKFIPDKYLVKWKERVKNSPTTENSAKFVAMMMDTTKWENFADSTKIKTSLGTTKPEELLATGGPTLEMWVKSWNEKHGNSSDDENKINIESACLENDKGYVVRESGEDWNYLIDLSSNVDGLKDIMYFPHNSVYNECQGYWIISPSVMGDNSITEIGYNGEMSFAGCGNWNFGLRPVVCLPSDITAEWDDEEEIWEIKKKNYNNPSLADGSWDENEGVNTPKLVQGLIPVTFNNDGSVTEISSDDYSSWYDYAHKKWANAITKDQDDNITGYWVWIPRYEYKVNSSTHSFKVKFIPVTQTTEDSGYDHIHPAFRDGSSTHFMNGEWDSELPGFWVAKFPAGYQQNTITDSNGTLSTTISNSGDTLVLSDKKYTNTWTFEDITVPIGTINTSTNMSLPVFIPLTYTYNCICAGDCYTLGQEVSKSLDFYGLSQNSNSHILKNSEWGAITYLAESQYGRNGTEISINNHYTSFQEEPYRENLTGVYSDGDEYWMDDDIENVNAWYTSVGQGGSSTGNKTGVYDLNGCAGERIAGYITNGSYYFNINNGELNWVTSTATPNGYQTLSTKYYTVYPYDENNDTDTGNWSFYNGLKSSTYGYGDAILETSTLGTGTNAWFVANSIYFEGDFPFMERGGSAGGGYNSGLFDYEQGPGSGNSGVGFRVILCP